MKKQNKTSVSLREVKRRSNLIRSPRSARDDISQNATSNNNSYQRIYAVVKKIPKGKVMTYGQVAILANVATPRVVGFALHVNSDPENIPCHRVVFANGKLTPGYAFGGEDVQRAKLKSEGVVFTTKNLVDLEKSKLS